MVLGGVGTTASGLAGLATTAAGAVVLGAGAIVVTTAAGAVVEGDGSEDGSHALVNNKAAVAARSRTGRKVRRFIGDPRHVWVAGPRLQHDPPKLIYRAAMVSVQRGRAWPLVHDRLLYPATGSAVSPRRRC